MAQTLMKTGDKPPAPRLAGLRKSAILLVTLGHEASAALIRDLPEEDVRAISAEIASLGTISPDEADKVVEDFHHLAVAGDSVVSGGMDYARKMLENAFGPESAERLVNQVSRILDDESLGLLQKADPLQLLKFLQNEHPQTVALVLSRVDPAHAAKLLGALAEPVRSEVAIRIATLDRVAPEVLERIATILGERLKKLGASSRKATGGVRALAEILNALDPKLADEILETVANTDAALAEAARGMTMVFKDLILIDKQGIQALLGKLDRKLLTMALKGTSEQLRNHFTQCMSQRAADMLREDMEALGPVKLRDVEAAQQQILAVVREMQGEGALSIGGADQYVV